MIRNIFILMISISSLFADRLPHVGDKAPDIVVEKIVGNPYLKNVTLNDFPDQIVILEFWATWCPACIPVLDHMSQLQEKFPGRVTVLAIALDSEQVLKHFLEKRPQSILIGVDSDSSCFDAYSPQTIPHSVIIDKNRRIVAITNPEEVTTEKLNKLLAGEPVHFKKKNHTSEPPELNSSKDEISDSTIFYLKIRPSVNEDTFMQVKRDSVQALHRVTFSHIPITTLYQFAYNLNARKYLKLNFRDNEKYSYQNAEKYYFNLIVPKHKDLMQIMRSILSQTFNVTAKFEKREADVKLLKVVQPGKIKTTVSDSTIFTFRGPELTARNIPFSKFLVYVENFLSKPVVDETELKGKYDIHFKWSFSDKTSFKRELKRLGLELVDAKRKVKFLVIGEKLK